MKQHGCINVGFLTRIKYMLSKLCGHFSFTRAIVTVIADIHSDPWLYVQQWCNILGSLAGLVSSSGCSVVSWVVRGVVGVAVGVVSTGSAVIICSASATCTTYQVGRGRGERGGGRGDRER